MSGQGFGFQTHRCKAVLSTQDLEMPRRVTLVGVTQYSGLTDCTAASGWVMSCCSTRNMIVAQGIGAISCALREAADRA